MEAYENSVQFTIGLFFRSVILCDFFYSPNTKGLKDGPGDEKVTTFNKRKLR